MPEKAPQQQLPPAGTRRELLELLAILAHDDLDRTLVVELAAAIPGEHDARVEIEALLEDRVLEENGPRLLIAEELALALREEMGPGLRRERSTQALSLIFSIVPGDPDDYRSWDASEAIYPHALAAVSEAEALELDAPAILGLLSFAAEYRASRGDLMLAQELATRAAHHSNPGRSDSLEVRWRRVLALLQGNLDEFEDALLLLESALALEPHLTEDDIELLPTRVALVDTLISLDSLERARKELEPLSRAPASPRLAVEIEETQAWLLHREGDSAEASKVYGNALAHAERELGDGHPDCARILYSLAVIGYERGALEEAWGWLNRAREITNATFGEDHPQAGFIASVEARILLEEGKPQLARVHGERGLAIGEATLTPHHTSLWMRHRTNRKILLALNALAEAGHHAEQALAIAQEGPRSKPADMAISLSELAYVERRLGDLRAAREHFQRSVVLTEAADEKGEQMLAQRTLALGETERDLGELEAAVEHLSASLLTYEQLEDGASLQAAMPRLQLAELQATAVEHAATAMGALGGEGKSELEAISKQVFSQTLTGVLTELEAAPGDPSDDVLRAFIAVADAGRGREKEQSLRALERAGELPDLTRSQRLNLAAAWQRHGRACRDDGDLSAAHEAFEVAAAMLDDLPSYQGVMLHDIADVHHVAERFDAAADAYRRAADRKAESPNSDPLDLAASLIMLGRTLEKLEDYDGAAEVYQRRLALLESLSRRDPQAEGVTLHELADVRRAQKRTDEAIELYRRAIERKREHGDTPADLATSLMAVGRLLVKLDRFDEASSAFEERVEVLSSLDPPRLQIEGVALHDLADVRRAQKRTDEAVELYKRAAELKREAGQDPFDLTFTLRALSRAYRDNDAYRDAEPVLDECLSILESAPQPNLQAEGVILHDIADCRVAQGREVEAIELYREAVERKREGGYDDFDLGISLSMLGRTLLRVEQYEEAISALRERLKILEAMSERNPAAEGVTLHGLAEATSESGDSEAALELFRRAVERKRVAGADAPVASLSASLLNLGILELSRERAVAVSTIAEAIALMRDTAQPDPYRLASALIFHAAALEDSQQGIDELRESHELLRADAETPPPEAAALCMLCAATFRSAGLDDEAEATLATAEQKLEAYFSESDRPTKPEGLATLVSMALESRSEGIAESCIDYLRAARQATPQDQVLVRSLCDALRRLALHRAQGGDLTRARAHLEEALGALSDLDSTEYALEGEFHHEIGDLFLREGELTVAGDRYRRAAERRRRAGEDCSPYDLAMSLVALGKVELDQGAHEGPLPLAEEALALLRSEATPDEIAVSAASALRAEALGVKGELVEAVAVLEEAEAYLSSSGVDDRPTLALLKMLGARFHGELGDDRRADELQAEFEQLKPPSS